MPTFSAISSWVNSARYNCQRPPSPFGQRLASASILGMVVLPFGWPLRADAEN